MPSSYSKGKENHVAHRRRAVWVI
uniref:Uncharacterized protein n=1 Tax=Anguilla anguilla TaxID=7936 RepID=A0A0E9T4I7_ANGAN